MQLQAMLQSGGGPGTLVLWLSVAVLLFVLMRTLRNQARSPGREKDLLRARVFLARLEIAQIEGANWIRKHDSATRISRRATALNEVQLESLRRISARQGLAGVR
jgi:hypothetical protein